jgi:perosamine synthetase
VPANGKNGVIEGRNKMTPFPLKIALSVPEWGPEEMWSVWKYIVRGFSRSAERITKLEERICSVLKVRYCITTSLGREALYVGLQALRLKGGEGVILPSYVCGSVLEPIVRLGGIPQYVDIGEDLNIDPASVMRRIDEKTRVILLPHLFGKSGAIDSIMSIAQQNNLFVIDDAAQALGGKSGDRYLGTIGDCGILSFGPFKGVMATRGGAFLTNNKDIYRRAKEVELQETLPWEGLKRFLKYIVKFRLRKYSYFFIEKNKIRREKETGLGEKGKPLLQFPMKKMSLLDAEIVNWQLDKLNEIVRKRMEIAGKLLKRIEDVREIELPLGECKEHVFSKFVVLVKKNRMDQYSTPAESLVAYLRHYGIESEPWCYIPLHLKAKSSNSIELKNTERLWERVVGLPLHTKMTDSDVLYMSKVLRNYFIEL